MNDILHDHIAVGYCVCYCEDLLICTESDDLAEHLAKLTAVLDTLREHDLLVQGSNTELFRTEVEFLGFKISAQGWALTESLDSGSSCGRQGASGLWSKFLAPGETQLQATI